MLWSVRVLPAIMNTISHKLPARVVENSPWGHRGKRLRLHIQLDFVPGQWVSLSSPKHPELESRMYSIASTPEDPWVDLLYTLVPNGVLTPWMWELEPDDQVYISQPAGSFIPKPEPSLWIAAGTGIAPFLSMTNLIRTGWFPKDSLPWLLHSNRSGQDLFGYHTFSTLAHLGLLNYRPFITGTRLDSELVISVESDNYQADLVQRSSDPFPTQQQRITNWIQDHPNPQWFASFQRVMICGSTPMILDLRDILLGKGLDFQSIVSEVYF